MQIIQLYSSDTFRMYVKRKLENFTYKQKAPKLGKISFEWDQMKILRFLFTFEYFSTFWISLIYFHVFRTCPAQACSTPLHFPCTMTFVSRRWEFVWVSCAVDAENSSCVFWSYTLYCTKILDTSSSSCYYLNISAF